MSPLLPINALGGVVLDTTSADRRVGRAQCMVLPCAALLPLVASASSEAAPGSSSSVLPPSDDATGDRDLEPRGPPLRRSRERRRNLLPPGARAPRRKRAGCDVEEEEEDQGRAPATPAECPRSRFRARPRGIGGRSAMMLLLLLLLLLTLSLLLLSLRCLRRDPLSCHSPPPSSSGTCGTSGCISAAGSAPGSCFHALLPSSAAVMEWCRMLCCAAAGSRSPSVASSSLSWRSESSGGTHGGGGVVRDPTMGLGNADGVHGGVPAAEPVCVEA